MESFGGGGKKLISTLRKYKKNKKLILKKDNIVYLPGLNGLRAIAALSVVIAHISQKGIADFGLSLIAELPMAGFGVTLFFVISGFLITFLLIKEFDKTNTIDVGKFYLRRIFRIWPIYYLFIVICFIVFLLTKEQQLLHNTQMLWYVFFAANIPFIFKNGILILVHYWSIGVEEQFYLFWPGLVKLSKNKLLITASALFVLFLILKLVFWYFFGNQSYLYRFVSVTRFHCMMIGAIGAILYLNKSKIIFKLQNKFVQLIAWGVFITLGLNIIYIPSVISHEIIAIASLSMIVGQISINKRLFSLENYFFDFIGKISYGMYVIHPLLVYLLSRLYKHLDIYIPLKYFLVYSSVIGLTVFFAWVSYRYFETPFLKLKAKFTIVKSSNSMREHKN